MPTTEFDVIVVGAGVEGSATAYDLSRRQLKVLLLEQFPLPHSRGSSHGQSRVTRKAYTQSYYTKMMEYCTHEWKQLQALAGDTLFRQVGYLAIGEHNGHFLQENIDCLAQINAPYKILTPTQFKQDFPMLEYSEKIGGVLDLDGGILMADKALHAFHQLFKQNGGTLRDNEKVFQIIPGARIHIKTTKGQYQCKSVILACGPWTNKVLHHLGLQLPLKVLRISVCYWPEKELGTYSAARLPTFFEDSAILGHHIYGLPSEEYPGHVKICLHYGPEVDPEARDAPNTQWIVNLLKDYVRAHFPGLEPMPSIMESCMYTNTPDKDCILDHHPKWKNIVIGAGFSGHGFKLAPAVGQILADLALGHKPKYDLSPFKMERFGVQPGRAKL